MVIPIQRWQSFREGTARLPGVEIFRSGHHRGKDYTEGDIKDMVSNFNRYSVGGRKPGVNVPAVIGHEENQQWLDRSDLPAAGWASKLGYERQQCPICNGEGTTENEGRKSVCPDCHGKGSVLVAKADFDDIPQKVKKLLNSKAYRTVSSEVYDAIPDGLPDAGKKSKMLRRVAFLGGEIPQIKTLEDIPIAEDHSESLTSYERVELRCSGAQCRNDCGTFAVFYECNRPARGDSERRGAESWAAKYAECPTVERFCMTGTPKPGPCPEGQGGGGQAGKQGATRTHVIEAVRAVKATRDEKHKKAIGSKLKALAAEIKAAPPKKVASISHKVKHTVVSAVGRIGHRLGVLDKASQTQALHSIIGTAEGWVNSYLLTDPHLGLSAPSAARVASAVVVFAINKTLKALKGANLLAEADLDPKALQLAVSCTKELIEAIKKELGTKKPMPSDEELHKMLAGNKAKKFAAPRAKGYKPLGSQTSMLNKPAKPAAPKPTAPPKPAGTQRRSAAPSVARIAAKPAAAPKANPAGPRKPKIAGTVQPVGPKKPGAQTVRLKKTGFGQAGSVHTALVNPNKGASHAQNAGFHKSLMNHHVRSANAAQAAGNSKLAAAHQAAASHHQSAHALHANTGMHRAAKAGNSYAKATVARHAIGLHPSVRVRPHAETGELAFFPIDHAEPFSEDELIVVEFDDRPDYEVTVFRAG